MQRSDPIRAHLRISPAQEAALARLGIETVGDMLRHFPSRYGEEAVRRSVASLLPGETAAVFGTIERLKASKAFVKKIPMASGILRDESGEIEVVWFNQPYLAKMLAEGAPVRVEGRVSVRKKTGARYFSNPKVEKVESLPQGGSDSLFPEGAAPSALSPVYPETRGVSSNWMYHAVQKLFAKGALDALEEPLPEDMLLRYHLPGIRTAMVWIHAPQKPSDAEAARKRFAFEEIFFIQLSAQESRRAYAAEPAYHVRPPEGGLETFVSRFPFAMTGAQDRAIRTALTDCGKGVPMQRLLEGDVGSGKTAVAAALAYSALSTRPPGQSFGFLQTAYMAPTEILAVQHFESFTQYFRHLPVRIGLLTGSGCRIFPSKTDPSGSTEISRSQLLKWAGNGEIAVLVGTHALIQKSVRFKHLALAVIDEQHRFGTKQRQKLLRRAAGEDSPAPHLLSMTATPIPRTLALTVYGDLDLSVLDELPAGRKPVITEVVARDARERVYDALRADLAAGRQAYVICPRIDEPDPSKEAALAAKSAKEEARRLAEHVFPEHAIGLLHGKMRPADKDAAMAEFKAGTTRILVATSVVEVGVNVPNATAIIIEGAERFGLAQLHQLRGRVQRSSHQARCFIFADTASAEALARLKAFAATRDGFALAEEDLKRRGPGALAGDRQWGISDVAMDALRNLRLVEAARTEASRILDEDPDLSRHAGLRSELAIRGTEDIHFE